jgi:DNA polymerase I
MLTILIDADMVVYEMCSACEVETNWGDDFWTLHADAGEAFQRVDDRVAFLVDSVLRSMKYVGEYKIIMFLTDTRYTPNWRNSILSTYKASRKGKRKPVCYWAVVDKVKEAYEVVSEPGVEADDLIGIYATSTENTVIVSGDKDFLSVPGMNYNSRTGDLKKVTVAQADRYHLYQTLIGDTTDGYTGCPGCGPVMADKTLDADCSWEAVLAVFLKKGFTEADALVQARVARITRADCWDSKAKKVILWQPS